MIAEYICEQCREPRSYGSGRFCRRCYLLNSTIKVAKKLCIYLGFNKQEFRATIVILSSLKVGQTNKALVDFTGYSTTEVLSFSRNLRASGIWDNGLMYFDSEFDDPDLTWIVFILTILVATGVIIRVSADEDIKTRHQSRENGMTFNEG